jgi:hypothetical protein
MAVGTKTGGFPGNAIPLTGNSEIRQASSGTDVMTITLNSSVASTTGGRGLVVRQFDASQSTGGDVFVTEYDGIRGRRHTVQIGTTTSTGYTVSASQSGAFFVIGNATAGADAGWSTKPLLVTLPAQQAGLWYEFYCMGAMLSSGVTFQAAGASADIVYKGTVAQNKIHFGVASGVSAIGGGLRFHSNGTKWYAFQEPGYTSAAPATATMTLYGCT